MITLILGGARSGKSSVAEALASRLPPPITYVATALVDAGDADHLARVASHRARRDPSWQTVEAGPDLAEVLQTLPGSVLVDSLGTWVTGCPQLVADGTGLAEALRARPGDSVVVSEEVGLGVHPSTELGRHFRDALGDVNQAVAAVADQVLLVVAGRVLPLARP